MFTFFALIGLAAMASGSQPAAAGPAPEIATTICVVGGQGQLSYAFNGTCPSGTTSLRVDDPANLVPTCYLNSNGAIRKVTASTDCVKAPRSKKETFLLVPSLTNDQYFCAATVGGRLHFKGTNPPTCPSGQFAVVIKQANHPPVSDSQAVSVNEDSSVLITLSASDVDDQNLTFSIVAGQGPTNGTLGAIGAPDCTPANTCTATVTYTPNANYFGADSFKFKTFDGFANSADATVSITVVPVNDAPSFTKGANQTVAEDAGAQSVSGWATAISKGPANESTQTVTFNITDNTNPTLFSAGPAVSPSGTLTYTPASNANGTATITLNISDNGGTANGGVDTSAPQMFTINVTAVNDAPSFTKGGDQTVLEDAGAQSVANWATAISPGPADEAGQAVTFSITNNTNPSLFSAGPAVSSTGTLTYTPAADANGVATITLKAVDDGAPPAESATQTFEITVTPVNDAPSFTKGANETVAEDAGAQSVTGWATAISEGPANESAQIVSFNITDNTNAGLFSSGPAVSPAGTLTYTPAANANGTATITLNISDNGGTANGGVDTSATQTFDITITAVNDAPSFTKGVDQTVLEDAGAQSVANWATAISPGPADEAGQAITFSITNNTNPSLFSAGPAVSSTGTLTYTPAANASGVAMITLKAVDDGAPPAESATQTFEITVTPVNDAPSFDLPASPDQTVVQDLGPQTVAGFATNISAGPPDESGQALTFNVSNNNIALFTTQPDIDEVTGDLTYESDAGATGTATVSVYLTDTGGTADGGDDTSTTKTFDIVVRPPNATPVAQSQTAGDTVQAVEDNVKTITLTATDADDNDLTFSIVSGPTNGSLGTISAADCTTTLNTCTATVDYTPSANVNGTDDFTFKANDGIIDSAPATVDIAIAAVNDAPSFTKGANETVLEDAGAQSVANWATAISEGPANESGQTVTFNITNNTNPSLFSTAPAVSPSGTLTYTPAADANGSATITLTISDDGGTANSGVDTSATQTFDITVTAVNDAPSFTKGADQTVDEDAGAQSVANWATAISKGPANESGQTVTFNVTGNTNAGLFSAGPAVSPSGTLTYTPAANQNGSATITLTISDDGGTANGGVDTSASQMFTIDVTAVNDKPVAQNKPASAATAVQANMKRVGIDASLLTGVTDADTGVSGCSPTFSVASITAGSGGTVSNANLLTGTFDFDPAPGFVGTAIVNYTVSDNGCPGSATSDPATISLTVSGPVIWFVDPAVTGPGTGTLADPFKNLSAADAVDAAGHRVFVYSGSTTTGLALNSDEWLIGQAATGPFDGFFGITPPAGTIGRPTMGVGSVTIGGTVSLATDAKVQGVAISTGASSGLVGSGGISGFTVSQSSITTTTGTALNLTNATIGSGGVTLTSVSSNGAVNGIVLNNTGTAGGLTVAGGTIQSSTGPGVSLTSTQSVSLTSMTISNGLDDGIRGSSVTGLSIANSTVSNNGNAVTERGIEVTNLLGTASITNSTITSSADDNLYVLNNVVTALNLTVSGGTISETDAVTGNDGILLTANGSSNITASVTGVTFTNSRSDHIQIATDAVSAATVNVTIDGNTMTSTNSALVLGGGITVNPGGTASVTAVIRNHATFTGAASSAITVTSSQSSTVRATITNNAIGNAAVNGSGSSTGHGIALTRTNSSSILALITNNSIRQWTNSNGIDLTSGDGTGGALEATITSNTLSNPAAGAFPLHGVHLNSGTTAGNNQNNCVDLRSNTLTGSGVAANGGFDVRLRQRHLTSVRLPGYAGANNDNAAVQSFVIANNTIGPAGVSAANSVATAPPNGPGGGFVGGAACTQP